MTAPGEVVVVSCYELGHQPLAAASALGFLEQAGFRPRAIDLARQALPTGEELAGARLVLVSVPMHTALRIGIRAARRLRTLAPRAHLGFYGHYAVLNAEHLLTEGIADSVAGGEIETTLVELATALQAGGDARAVAALGLPGRPAAPVLQKLAFPVPRRSGLPSAAGYARLVHDGREIPAAAVEASRGCRFHCRHCPIPPVYGGRFFVVPREQVLGDIAQLVEQGVGHITFADPDFFNGPGHSMAVVRALHERFPQLTFDVTTKIELILKQRALVPELKRNGCLFVVSAVESLSDTVLAHLHKQHTRQDVHAALAVIRTAGLTLRPSFVAFTPWTELEDYIDVLDWIEREELVQQVDPVQFAIRLLVPPGSALAEFPAMQPHLRGLDRANFSWRWSHPDEAMERLYERVSTIVHSAAQAGEGAPQTFARIRDAAYAALGQPAPPRLGGIVCAGPQPPRLTEPWFC